MKKLFITFFAVCTLAITASAQGYNTGFGLFVDFGEGETFVGPHIKHFFTDNIAGQGLVLFAKGVTVVGVEGSYNGEIPNAKGLKWNIGIGPQALIGKSRTLFGLRPSAGLEFTVPSTPINIGFDWRPSLIFIDGSDFTPGRFGIALRYVL